MQGVPGAHIVDIGEHEGAEAFSIEPGEPATIGLPIIFLYKNGIAKQVEPHKALSLLATLGEDA